MLGIVVDNVYFYARQVDKDKGWTFRFNSHGELDPLAVIGTWTKL